MFHEAERRREKDANTIGVKDPQPPTKQTHRVTNKNQYNFNYIPSLTPTQIFSVLLKRFLGFGDLRV